MNDTPPRSVEDKPSLAARRSRLGLAIGTVHFLCSAAVVIYVLAGATSSAPTPPDDYEWVVFTLWVALLPSTLVGTMCFAVNGPLALLAVPVSSICWGMFLARMIVR